MDKKKSLWVYPVSVIIALGVGALSAFLTHNGMSFYAELVLPALAPPGSVFPIVWTILFMLMGVSAAMIFLGPSSPKRNRALIIYAIQLLVNFCWPLFFFNARAYLFSLCWLIMLWFLILVMIDVFAEINKRAAYWQLPYLLWVTFAGYLNLMIFLLNK